MALSEEEAWGGGEGARGMSVGGGEGLKLRNAFSTAGHSMTSSESPLRNHF